MCGGRQIKVIPLSLA